MLKYIASPYSHEDPKVRVERYWAVVKHAAEMMLGGDAVFSPIAHTHEIGILIGNAVDHEFWMRQDRAILRHCDELVVLMLPGWVQSRGVAEEVQIAKSLGIPIKYRPV